MTNLTHIFCAALVSLGMVGAADAKNDKPHKSGGYGVQSAAKCPPGLAKKSPACVPPGQAKKARRDGYARDYRTGDVFRDDYPVIRDYGRYGLPRPARGRDYYRVGDNILSVDANTRLVLDIISVVSRLSN